MSFFKINRSYSKIVFILFILTLSFQWSKAQLTSQFNAPSGTFLEDVVFADSNTVMVTGSNLYRTSNDGGRNWAGLSSGGMFVKAADFSSIHFGIAVGGGGYYRTNKDCGYFWGWSSNKYIGVNKDLLDVHFIDDLHGVVSGNDGTLRFTNDQGTTWTAVTTGTTNHIKGVYSINDSLFFACANGGIILKVENGLVIQNTVLNPSIDFNKVIFSSSSEGYIVGTQGTIYKTTDAGINWNLLPSGTTENLLSIEFTDINHGVVAGTNGKIFHTNDGGLNWTSAVSPPTGEVRSIAFRNQLEGYGVGSNFVIHTKNGGLNWTRLDGTMQKVHFPTPENGYAVGYFGVAFKTTDKGNNWTPMHVNTLQYLNDVHFINKDTGYVVGGAEIHRTLDGGETWNPIPNPSTSSLYSVHFTDYNHGVAGGYRRTLMVTNDGGATWTHTYNSSATVYYMEITFTTPLNGYFCSTSGEIFRTTNGGTSWTIMGLGSSLNSIYFSDVNNGWVVGSGGSIQHTGDGGNTYVNQTSGVTTWLSGVHFFDNNNGIVVGSAGTYLITHDGGNTWINRTSGTADYTDVFFTDPMHGYATSGVGVATVGSFSNYWSTSIYCPGDNIAFNSFDPYHISDGTTNVIYELTPVDGDFSSPLLSYSISMDSVGSILVPIPPDFSGGLYKTRLRNLNNPSEISFDKFITIADKPIVSFEIQGNNLVATSDQNVTFQWYYRASTSFTWVGNGAILPIQGEGDYYVNAVSDCCNSQSETETIVLCNSQYVFAGHSIIQTICNGESFTVGSNLYSASGNYTDSLINQFGCDSIISTSLTVLPLDTINIQPIICFNETFNVGGSVYSISGLFTDTLSGYDGCDSIVYTNLTVLPQSSSSTSESVCNGDSIIFNGNYYSAVGTFSDTLVSISGCDSIVSLQLTILPTDSINQIFTLCEGDVIMVGTNIYTTSGNYMDILVNEEGCDSIVYTQININNLPDISLGNDSLLCEGDTLILDAGTNLATYLWNGGETNSFINVSDSGTYWVLATDINGCSGTDTVNVNFDICTGTDEYNRYGITIFPNPTRDHFFIQLPKDISYEFEITDISGKQIEKSFGQGRKMIDVSTLADGVYLVTVFIDMKIENNSLLIIGK